MGKRGGRKPKPPPVSVAGQYGRNVEFVEVDDPFEPMTKIVVAKNRNASPLEHIFARGRLTGPNDTEQDGWARKLAGDWFRTVYEKAEMSDAKAIDYSAVKVDVSFTYSGLSESKAFALEELSRLATFMGRESYHVVYEICGKETWLDAFIQIDRPNRHPGRNDRLEAYAALRGGLDLVIEYRGVSSGTGWKMRAERMDD